jgi:crotonobetainyl-CoA:carnitine CoA-transferase CaiB-like acyl-CoA transferase
VRGLRPDIVYAEISGYGPDGPYAERNAYDLVVQGETGLISITGTPEEPARVGVSICDVGAGSYAAVATAAALARRARTGEGERVSVSLFDTMVDWLGYFPHQWWHRQEVPPRTGMRHPHFCPYGPFPAGDGKLFGFAVLSDAHWRAFTHEVVARPDLPTALRQQRIAGRAGIWAARPGLLGSQCRGMAGLLRPAHIPCGAVNAIPGDGAPAARPQPARG